jgi:hypothetical protein
MKAEGLTPLQILQNPQRLMVPLFQRPYVLLAEHFSDFALDVYTMATRAQALLAIVGEPEALELLDSL